MTNISKLLLGGALVAAAATPALSARLSPEAQLDKLLAGRVAGKPVSCIYLRDIQSTQIIDKTAIVYRAGNKLYVNRPRSGASWLDRDNILVTKTVTGNLCRIDSVNLVDRSSLFPRGFVSLGEFVPYTKPR